jgi:hypothetical protein
MNGSSHLYQPCSQVCFEVARFGVVNECIALPSPCVQVPRKGCSSWYMSTANLWSLGRLSLHLNWSLGSDVVDVVPVVEVG